MGAYTIAHTNKTNTISKCAAAQDSLHLGKYDIRLMVK